jgi:hypothetical protein
VARDFSKFKLPEGYLQKLNEGIPDLSRIQQGLPDLSALALSEEQKRAFKRIGECEPPDIPQQPAAEQPAEPGAKLRSEASAAEQPETEERQLAKVERRRVAKAQRHWIAAVEQADEERTAEAEPTAPAQQAESPKPTRYQETIREFANDTWPDGIPHTAEVVRVIADSEIWECLCRERGLGKRKPDFHTVNRALNRE